MAIMQIPPPPPPYPIKNGKRDLSYQFNRRTWRWENKSRWTLDFEKALRKLDREFPGMKAIE